MAEAAPNPFNTNRPPLWMVTYDLAPSFLTLDGMEQYQKELADAEIGVQLLLKRKWKAAYTSSPDFQKGWILLRVANQAAAEELVRGYVMFKYFANLEYRPVYSATTAGFNFKIIWGGIKRFLGIPPKQSGSLVPKALAVTGLLVLAAALAILLLWWGFSKVV